MLWIDLNLLRQDGRARIEKDIAADDPFWQDMDVTPRLPLQVRLEAQQAGHDVVVRGRASGSFGLSCRRCLEPVTAQIDEELGLLYREGEALEEGLEGEGGDVLPLPETGTELDLTGPVREQVLLAVPRFAYCREDCKGFCPQCGTNLNETTCDCTAEEPDDRWAPLRRLMKDT